MTDTRGRAIVRRVGWGEDLREFHAGGYPLRTRRGPRQEGDEHDDGQVRAQDA